MLPCRAIAVDGDVRAEMHAENGADAGLPPLLLQNEIPVGLWLELGAGARLVAKDPRSTRETTFLGPARAQACVRRQEESWLDWGKFESVVGAGETPGAEEWVVTSLAVVRYGAAKLAVEARPRPPEVGVTVESGSAFVWLPDDARVRGRASNDGGADAEGWVRLSEGATTIVPTGAHPALDAARAAVGRCTTLATTTQDLAKALLTRDSGATGPATATQQVTTRRQARAACAVASMRVGPLSAGQPRDTLTASLEAARGAWSVLPLGAGAAAGPALR